MKTKEKRITKKMNLGEVVRKHPKTAEIMLEYGLHCSGCFFNQFDTIEDGAKIHNLGKKDIEEMIKRINNAIE